MTRFRPRHPSAVEQLTLWVVAGGVSLFVLSDSLLGDREWPDTVFNVAVLLITARSLEFAIPSPARLAIARQDELGYDDLIFYVYDGEPEVPRNINLQLHVAVANVGGRRGVLSALVLDAFLDAHGDTVPLIAEPLFSPPSAHMYLVRDWWQGIQRSDLREQVRPPFTLQPDDVVPLRFRINWGVDWSDRWDLDRLRALSQAIEHPIVGARLRASYRRGADLLTESFEVPVKVLQQERYRSALAGVTKDFAVRPPVEPVPLDIG